MALHSKVIDSHLVIMHNNAAAFETGTSNLRIYKDRRESISPYIRGFWVNQACVGQEFRLVCRPVRASKYAGFSFAAASAAKDKAPTWASCTGYIGHRQPLGASRANLAKVSRNLFRLSGIMSGMRNRISQSSALGICCIAGMEKDGILYLCPFE